MMLKHCSQMLTT